LVLRSTITGFHKSAIKGYKKGGREAEKCDELRRKGEGTYGKALTGTHSNVERGISWGLGDYGSNDSMATLKYCFTRESLGFSTFCKGVRTRT